MNHAPPPSEWLHRNTIDALMGHIAVIDDRGAIVTTNKAWRDFATRNGLDWRRVDQGCDYLAVCDAAAGRGVDEARLVSGAIRDVLAGRRELFVLEYPCHSPDQRRWFLLRVTQFGQDASRYAVLSHQDITERRLSDEAREAAQDRFEALFEFSPDATLITDAAGVVTLVNRQAEVLFGYTRQELVGQPVELLVPVTSRTSLAALRRQFSDAGVARVMGSSSGSPLVGRRKDGTEFPAEVSLSPLSMDGGMAVVASVRDQTERQRLETRLRQAEKMETIGRMAGGIAHDFNNMLSVINSTADLAASALDAGDPVVDDLEAIRAAGSRAAAMTQQLLAFSRQQVLQPTDLDLGELVELMTPVLGRLIGEHIRVDVRRADALGRVRADPTQVEQLLLNLASNARDAMPAGGVLTIDLTNVTLDEQFQTSHSGSRSGPHICLAVADTGTGMERSTLERMFDPFFTTKDVGRGTGLGLATVYGIVTQSGGTITCDSEVGAGTTFKVHLPVAEGAGGPSKTTTAMRPAHGSETILVIEDEAALRRVAERVLSRHGYTVLLAEGGDDALRLAESYGGPIHLALTDVVMPGMSGGQLAIRLKDLLPQVKVLFTSGYTGDSIGDGVLEEGADFLAKPYSLRTLVEKVRAVLDA